MYPNNLDRNEPVIPIWLWIDPTRRCNLKCALCYTRASHADFDLEEEDLATILENIRSESRLAVTLVHLNWRGEPLMNPRFAHLLQMTLSSFPGIPCHWHTNGALLSPSIADELCTTDPHLIYVSIDGGNQQSHDRNRGPGSFEAALRGCENLLASRERNGSAHQIGIYQLDMDVSPDDYDPRFRELTQLVDTWTLERPVLNRGLERTSAMETRANQATRPRGACFWAGNALCIDPKGDVSVCLLSHQPSGVFGNLLREPIWDIVQRLRHFRQVLDQAGRQSVAHCRRCLKKEGQPIVDHKTEIDILG